MRQLHEEREVSVNHFHTELWTQPASGGQPVSKKFTEAPTSKYAKHRVRDRNTDQNIQNLLSSPHRGCQAQTQKISGESTEKGDEQTVPKK